MILRPTTVHENARSALECGSEAERSCRLALDKKKAVAVRRLTDTALQGASRMFMAAKNLCGCFVLELRRFLSRDCGIRMTARLSFRDAKRGHLRFALASR
jgi:hypothetical protein